MKEIPSVSDRSAKQAKRDIQRGLEKLPSERRKVVASFIDYLRANGASASSQRNYIAAILTLERVGKRYEEFEREDVVRWATQLEAKRSPSTVMTYKVLVKRFLRWASNGHDDQGEYPACVRWLKLGRKRRSYGKRVLIKEDILNLVNAADNQRDRALLFVAYESGCRAGELLGLRVGDIELDRYGAVIRVCGKTGERRIRLIESVPDLRLWLNMHQGKDQDSAPLWLSLKGHKALGYDGLKHTVDRYAERVGLQKDVSPHSFRHARATHLATVLKEAQMREFFGWTRNSDMPSIYVHLSGRDVDNTLLEHYGVKRPEGEAVDPLALRVCVNCQHENSAAAKFCQRCGAVLDLKTAINLDRAREKADRITERVLKEMIRRVPEAVSQAIAETGASQEIEGLRAELERTAKAQV